VPSGCLYPTIGTNQEAARFLKQAQLSANDANISALRGAGFSSWLQQQVALPVSLSGWDWLDRQGYGNVLNTANYYDSTAPADCMAWSQLMAAHSHSPSRFQGFNLSLVSENGEHRSFDRASYMDQKPWVRLRANNTFQGEFVEKSTMTNGHSLRGSSLEASLAMTRGTTMRVM